MAVVGSVTAAARIQRDLEKMGFLNARVVNTPVNLSNGSCSYSVKLTEGGMQNVINAAIRRKVKIKGIYAVRQEGGEYIYENISG